MENGKRNGLGMLYQKSESGKYDQAFILAEFTDGNIYYSGSDIEINKLGGGITIQTGLQFDVAKQIGIRFDVGYRYWGEQEGWNYEVTDGSNTSKLPASGFVDNPFTLDIAGLTYRIGLLYRIDK